MAAASPGDRAAGAHGRRRSRTGGPGGALLVVDLQPDFLPGGRLAVAEGDVILPGITGLMQSQGFDVLVATQDWHPPGHASFASSHRNREPMETIELHGHEQILWPDHCVQDTPGAELKSGLPWHRADVIVRKATDPEVDSYSTFRDNWGPGGERPSTGLAGLLRDRGIETVFLCGLARDFCVRWSAEDAVDAGFSTTVIWDLTRGVDPDSDDEVRAALIEKGVRLLSSGDL